MRIASPRLPEWYVQDVPIFLIACRDLSAEDQQTLLILWACAQEAVRDGCDPAWMRADIVALLQRRLGLTASQAYRRLSRLLGLSLGGNAFCGRA
jgi:hypothetical protein